MIESTDLESIPLSSKNYHMNTRFHPFIKDFARSARGDVLDIGCGKKPHRQWFSDIDSYTGLDIDDVGQADVCGTATRLPFHDDTFNSILSTQVLEHVPDPFAFFSEVNRVLKSGGRTFISTNQMYPLHETPHDYYRFTRYGLEYLAKRANLTVEHTLEVGSLPMRMCCEINYFSQKAPGPLHKLFCALNNCLFSPIIEWDKRGDHIITAVVLSQE